MSLLARWIVGLSLGFCLCAIEGPQQSWAEDISPKLAEFLKQGQLAAAEKSLAETIAQDPQQHQARFALGVVEVLSAIEHLGQDQYRYGALSGRVRDLPVFRLPVPVNPNPEPVTYEQVRQIFADLQTRLVAAEAELAKVDVQADVKLSIDLASIRIDLNGDGQVEDSESFAAIFSVANRQRAGAAARDMQVKFDGGDVPWLRGYCHFLCAVCDVVLAYDHQQMFDLAGQWIYPKHVSSQPIAGEPLDIEGGNGGFDREILDAIAAIHLADFPVREPQRMASARGHLLAMIRTSRESWMRIQAETDDDQEWLPNPRQTGVLQIPVTQEMIDGWRGVLVEMEDLLEGRKLVPFWRDHVRFLGPMNPVLQEGRGINLKRFFEEPTEFDLVLFIQGSGALPYVERGQLSHPETWRNLQRLFRGQFFGFAVWFN